jgi:hypothetical protein
MATTVSGLGPFLRSSSVDIKSLLSKMNDWAVVTGWASPDSKPSKSQILHLGITSPAGYSHPMLIMDDVIDGDKCGHE